MVVSSGGGVCVLGACCFFCDSATVRTVNVADDDIALLFNTAQQQRGAVSCFVGPKRGVRGYWQVNTGSSDRAGDRTAASAEDMRESRGESRVEC